MFNFNKDKDGVVFDENSRLIVDKKIGEYVRPDGLRIIQVERKVVNQPWINLGSMKHPKNADIVRFEWIDISPIRQEEFLEY
jgi:hypothetical protein